ncbi:putative CRISPR-associated protein [Pyrobaculum neutrophilum]|uniref:CRISPR-associated protein, APE2256 family n=1 Tax=Pyrobaculum neutrophilum (strain DSM 2338 / JCM 9278 / NBRC 100436 / V24Sta) TaxID=444157 RepID=B1YC79_PYRNV|nr:putative CRISPR-associated protein [Pyrobaculum neutrophilum]ACB39392.1 CRISPR-associated protein, APE2256 family [Pyrobaculum neutrophilum V24Sta]
MRPVFFAVTVGISLLVNAQRDGARDIVEYAVQNPRRASAELNTLLSLRERWPALFSRPAAALYATDTDDGRRAAEALAQAVERLIQVKAQVKVIQQLGKDFEKGLLNLAKEVARDVRTARAGGALAYVVATGGFKPESTYAAAYLAGANGVAYIHETFREAVLLPMTPLDVADAVKKFHRGEIDEGLLARALGLDVQHLEAIGLLTPDRALNPLLAELLGDT